MEGVHVVLTDTHPIGGAGKRLLALVHQLFHGLAPAAALIEMHGSIEPELALALYQESHLVTPQILVLRDGEAIAWAIRAGLVVNSPRKPDALSNLSASAT